MVVRPVSLYQKILQAQTSSTVENIVNQENSKRIRVHMPAKVIAVNGNTVDVQIQGQEDSGLGYYVNFAPLLDLPIVYNNYTRKAFIITPIQVGDTGLVEFLDFNSSAFSDDGKASLTNDQLPHSLNNGVFINGFIPTSKVIEIEDIDNALTMGLRNKTYTFSVDDTGTLNIHSLSTNFSSTTDINIDTPNFNCSGSVSCGDGATGTFSSADGKTITVTNGIITSIE